VREAAIVALGEIGGRDATETLEHIAAEGDERMREAAAEALAAAEFATDPLGAKVREPS
jgi:HEAT repeat protein